MRVRTAASPACIVDIPGSIASPSKGTISGPEPRHLRTLDAEPSLVGDGGKWA